MSMIGVGEGIKGLLGSTSQILDGVIKKKEQAGSLGDLMEMIGTLDLDPKMKGGLMNMLGGKFQRLTGNTWTPAAEQQKGLEMAKKLGAVVDPTPGTPQKSQAEKIQERADDLYQKQFGPLGIVKVQRGVYDPAVRVVDDGLDLFGERPDVKAPRVGLGANNLGPKRTGVK